MSQNKVTFGLKDVHVAFVTDNGEDPSWEAPIAVPGAVRWTPEAVGDSSDFYADNTKYFTITANNGYTGELEMANIPDEVLAEMLGWELDDNGMIVEVSDATPVHFALIGPVQGDKRNRRFVYYDCVASRPAKERTTVEESVTPATDVLNVTVSPIELDDRMVVKGDLELSEVNSTEIKGIFDKYYTNSFVVDVVVRGRGCR